MLAVFIAGSSLTREKHERQFIFLFYFILIFVNTVDYAI